MITEEDKEIAKQKQLAGRNPSMSFSESTYKCKHSIHLFMLKCQQTNYLLYTNVICAFIK